MYINSCVYVSDWNLVSWDFTLLSYKLTPLPLQPYTWMVSECFTVGTTRGVFTFSCPDSRFFRWNSWKGSSSENLTLHQSMYLLQNFNLSLMFFLEISGLFAAIIDTKPLSKSLHLTVHVHAITSTYCYHSASSLVVTHNYETDSSGEEGPSAY